MLTLKQARLNKSSLNERKIVSVRMADYILESIKEALVIEGLSARKRSAWISSAIQLLENELNAIDDNDKTLFIRQAQSITGEGKAVPITLSDEANHVLRVLRDFCEQHAPEVNDAQSRMIHLAITLKLLKVGVKLT